MLPNMEPTYRKNSDEKLVITKTIEMVEQYSVSELKGRRSGLQKQIDAIDAQLTEAGRLGVAEVASVNIG